MKTLIKIDRNTVRENPSAGQNTYYLPLPQIVHKDEHGRITQIENPVQILHTLGLAPKYLFEYTPTEVECESCGGKFLHTELLEDYDFCELLNICPICKEAFCCSLEYEKL
jgi:hypothetical protein